MKELYDKLGRVIEEDNIVACVQSQYMTIGIVKKRSGSLMIVPYEDNHALDMHSIYAKNLSNSAYMGITKNEYTRSSVIILKKK